MNPRTRIIITVFAGAIISACEADVENRLIVGQLESDRIELTAEFSEPVVERAVTEGQSVTAGQVLVVQDTARIEARIAEARGAQLQATARHDELIRGPRREQIVAAQADVDGAEHALDFRSKDLERARQVYERNLASPELRDRAQAAYDAARADLEAKRARLEELLSGTTTEELRQAKEAVTQAEARLTSLQVDLSRHSTAAPVDGVIDSILYEVGERPAIGKPVTVLLPGEQPHARVFVPEALRASIATGSRARIHVDGVNRILDGRVRWVSNEAAFTPYFALTERDRGRLTYAAKIDIVDYDSRLPDGLPVEVELVPIR